MLQAAGGITAFADKAWPSVTTLIEKGTSKERDRIQGLSVSATAAHAVITTRFLGAEAACFAGILRMDGKMTETAIREWLQDPPDMGTFSDGKDLTVSLHWEAVKAMTVREQRAIGAGLIKTEWSAMSKLPKWTALVGTLTAKENSVRNAEMYHTLSEGLLDRSQAVHVPHHQNS